MVAFSIYRFEVSGGVTGLTTIRLPAAAVVVDFQMKGSEFHLWAQVTTMSEVYEDRRFLVVPTGERWLPDDYRYLRTCHWIRGTSHLVWHLLEVVRT